MTKILMAIAVFASAAAFGAGFEKSTIQSGKYMGYGGAVTSFAAGSEALYFNPAGLIGGEKENEITGNLSPTFINFKAPNAVADRQETSERWGPPNGVFYRRKLSDTLALGIGSYTAGGNSTEYNEVQIPSATGNFAYKPNIFTRLAITEFSAGVGYKFSDKLKLGFAWRGGIAQIDQGGAAVTNGQTVLIAQEYRGLKGSSMMGYRLGAQYDINESWGVGFSYRNAMHFAASGKLYVKAQTSTGITADSAETDMSVKTQLPQQLNLGTHYKFNDKWTGFFEYDWTNYGVVDRLMYEGSYSTTITGAGPLPEQYVGWSDQHNLRFAGEYSGFDAPVRFGYVYTSRVASNNYATSTLAPPGAGHTVSLGSGHSWWEKTLDVNGAVDYTIISGSVGPNDPLNAGATTRATTKAGNYEASVVTVHIGATYGF